MALNSLAFIVFLPLVVGINFLIRREYRYLWLFLASCYFYLSNNVGFWVGMTVCTGTTYITGLLLDKLAGPRRKGILTFCIVVNVGMLFLYRYTDADTVLVPIGISFYSLQALGYLVDVYRRQIPAEKNFFKYALFVNFFPTVASGPIQRGTGLLQQIREGRDFDYGKAHAGLYCLLWGYLLKYLISNPLGNMVSYAYDDYAAMPGATLLWATVLYAVQLYCDFAAYSALAVGTGKLLGFDLLGNFLQPYFATSVKEFWKRWHISLSSWLRDYVYIPLGGSRKGKLRTYINLMITFIISGLWHGRGLQFLVWGAIHGIFQIVENCVRKGRRETKVAKNWVSRILRGLMTFALVDFAWLFFRADSLEAAVNICKRIIFEFQWKEMTYYGSYLLGGSKRDLLLLLVSMLTVLAVDVLHEKGILIENIARKCPIVLRWSAYIVLTVLIVYAAVCNYGVTATTFIYERF